jgi:cysteine desulfurase family protein
MNYFDNAATSWPKPKTVIKAMNHFFHHCGGNPGRSGHNKAIGAGRVILEAREEAADLFNIEDPSRIIFTKNATEALNIVLSGMSFSKKRIVTTSMEHNSILRPCTRLQEEGIEIVIIEADKDGSIAPKEIDAALEKEADLVAVTHASNITGTINDIEKIGSICARRGIPLLVDAAQTAGVVPIDVEKMHIDFLALSGHKGLLGPQGTGMLFIKDGRKLAPILRGGTGSLSDREIQPDFMPDKFESGTLNTIGIAGLGAGIKFIRERGVERIMDHDSRLLEVFLNEVGSEKKIRTFGIKKKGRQTGVLSITIDGIDPSRIGEILEKKYSLQTRIGLHCAPKAHRTIGTFPDGTVRFSWGVFTGERDVVRAAGALRQIAER